jgi:hypothetical protein
VLDARGRDAGDGFVVGDAGERDKSTDGLGVDAASEYAFDFRRAGGKKPSARRGMRPICVGLWSLGRSTQESCFQGGSVSGLEDMTECVSESLWRGVDQPFGRPCVSHFGALVLEVSPYSPSNRSSSGRASGPCAGRPLTPHASTGSTTAFFVCTLSLGHIRFDLRSIAWSQLYLMLMPASVSCGRTVCT